MPRLVDDAVNIIKTMFPQPPPLLIIGHSLGGAIAVHLTASQRLPVAALIVVDLVEGTALASLDHMVDVVNRRPAGFQQLEDAVHWALLAGAVRNIESARASMPDQLTKNETTPPVAREETDGTSPDSSTYYRYLWRTDLLASQPHWQDWFTNLSSTFLSCPMPKLLLLATSDRLDTPLMIAHMQGKLQLEVVANAGHSLQEDQPRETAKRIAEFIVRHKLPQSAQVWLKQQQQLQQTLAKQT